METLRLALNSSIDTQTIIQPVFNSQISLNQIFQHPAEESKVLTTKRKLGETAKTLTDEQIECLVTDFQYLIDTWLDEFEMSVFNGKTLRELLGEKAYANSK